MRKTQTPLIRELTREERKGRCAGSDAIGSQHRSAHRPEMRRRWMRAIVLVRVLLESCARQRASRMVGHVLGTNRRLVTSTRGHRASRGYPPAPSAPCCLTTTHPALRIAVLAVLRRQEPHSITRPSPALCLATLTRRPSRNPRRKKLKPAPPKPTRTSIPLGRVPSSTNHRPHQTALQNNTKKTCRARASRRPRSCCGTRA